ncbi:MAG: HK97 gp10 family phage protein [Lachnospiraceae bacterium]|nr:HK97 gp10 family phage protein [Lachnospiraceae bacterium]
MKITITGAEPLQKVLDELSDFQIHLNAVRAKQVTEISKRAAGPLGTPGATPRKEGELRLSAHADFNDFTFGYAKEYAGHVEYGHKTKNGKIVAGQFYLRTNKDIQAPIYKDDAGKRIEKVLNGGK